MTCCSTNADRTIWLCGGNETESEWVPTNHMITRWPHGKRRVPVPCCERWELPRNTECRWVTAFDGYFASHQFRCAPGKGCNIHPGYRRTAHLRCLFP